MLCSSSGLKPQRVSALNHCLRRALSAYLWASHQVDAFHTLATQFVDSVRTAIPHEPLPAPRWTVVLIPPELRKDDYRLFRKLQPHGVLFSNVSGLDGTAAIVERLAARASKIPVPYGHWYVDGGAPAPVASEAVSAFSWAESSPVREALLKKIQAVIDSGSSGPEMLRSIMAEWAPGDAKRDSGDPLVAQFVVNMYGGGSGTQIFSTTFVQWSARELLRRAEPLSLVVRYGPRQRQRSLNEMFSRAAAEMDYPGSLVDADFGAYYTWINMNRLAGAENASFIAWSEGHRQAVAIGPSLPRGASAPEPITLQHLLDVASPPDSSAGV